MTLVKKRGVTGDGRFSIYIDTTKPRAMHWQFSKFIHFSTNIQASTSEARIQQQYIYIIGQPKT